MPDARTESGLPEHERRVFSIRTWEAYPPRYLAERVYDLTVEINALNEIIDECRYCRPERDSMEAKA